MCFLPRSSGGVARSGMVRDWASHEVLSMEKLCVHFTDTSTTSNKQQPTTRRQINIMLASLVRTPSLSTNLATIRGCYRLRKPFKLITGSRLRQLPVLRCATTKSSSTASSTTTTGPLYQVVEFRVRDSDNASMIEDGTTSKSTTKPCSSRTIYQNDGSSSQWQVVTTNTHESTTSTSNQSDSNHNHTSFQQFQFQPKQLLTTLVTYFLPARYPHSVAEGYAKFSLLAFGASVAGSAAMVLSTQTLLLAVGVVGSNSIHAGNNAPIMAGALNWVLKDGIGQLGGVLWASKMGETRRLDADPKRARMVAALCLDGASLLEILSPLVYSAWVLPVACGANIAKNIGFLTASASRAAIHQSLARQGNLADVTAKAASQSMAAGLIGTTIGIGLSTLLNHDATNFILGFCVLSVFHQGGNYFSLKAVPLQHFNRHRLHLLVSHFLETKTILNPSELANYEQFFPLGNRKPDDSHTWLSIGSSLQVLCPGPHSVSDFNNLRTLLQEEAYLLNFVDATNRIELVFLQHATGTDLLRGMYHAHVLHSTTIQNKGTEDIDTNNTSTVDSVKASYQKAKASFESFHDELVKNSWQTGTDVTNIEPRAAYRLKIEDSDGRLIQQ